MRTDDIATGVIYFIQSGDGGPIKIGYTTNIERRLTALQTSAPQKLTILSALTGARYIESALHKKYEKYRISGEWFQCAQEILDDINIYKAMGFREIPAPKNMLVGKRKKFTPENRFQLVFVSGDWNYDVMWFRTEQEMRDFVEESHCDSRLMHIVDASEIRSAKEIRFDGSYY